MQSKTTPQQLIIKLQLPSVFTSQHQTELQLLGYIFDPLSRLTQLPEKNRNYDQTNVGSVLTIMDQQYKKALKLFDNKDWNNILRPIQPFAFELQLKVKIVNIRQTSVKLKSLEVKPKSNIYEIISINIDEQISEKDLTEKINNTAEILIKKASQKPIQTQNKQLSLAPQKIYNPHLFIKTVQQQKHIEYYTKGVYQYYHYGDQSFNDHGWGCAYRSLQTLLSWLNLQNYCKIPKMPTLTQIQDLIDRINLSSNQKLKNTRQWIGATEVSWVVKKMTNFDCRILHIADGKDIIEHCEIIRQHFQKVGCPVMYGGGEYAYSIVGLNYSWQLGECEFLILDPHYPGGDSLDKILQKKGLAWRKPNEMFKKGIFYNFCLPIIPAAQSI